MGDEKRDGIIPANVIHAQTIPEAHWKLLHELHFNGYNLRTQYDRQERGEFIDPPGKDSSLLVDIEEPFKKPRIGVVYNSELGKLAAEYLGAKDHLVMPYEQLLEEARKARETGKKFKPTLWPYCYHQRLSAYPSPDGTIDQLENMLEDLANDPITRRAIAVTGVPYIDQYVDADQPCLRELQLRAVEDETKSDKPYVLTMQTMWRSRDAFKAFPDNLYALSYLQYALTKRLEKKLEQRGIKRKVLSGPIRDYSSSKHIYGQDYHGTGAKFSGDHFFEVYPTAESYVQKSIELSEAMQELILMQLEQLKLETEWNFPLKSLKLIDRIKKDFENPEIAIGY
jgi:hypothetical protein